LLGCRTSLNGDGTPFSVAVGLGPVTDSLSVLEHGAVTVTVTYWVAGVAMAVGAVTVTVDAEQAEGETPLGVSVAEAVEDGCQLE
jgi:hypothetical protein